VLDAACDRCNDRCRRGAPARAVAGIDVSLLLEANESQAASVRVLGAGTKGKARKVQFKSHL
jgi:hypothetical protein